MELKLRHAIDCSISCTAIVVIFSVILDMTKKCLIITSNWLND